jgi:hypothetical protein
MKKQIVIGDQAFATKKAATEAIRAVLYAYESGATVSDEHDAFLRGLIALHPESESKVGAGVESFQVQDNAYVNSRGFWLTRVDGTRTDFSFVSCLTPPSREAEAKKAFRTEVRRQLEAFRDRNYKPGQVLFCEVTGEPITRETAHVDHNPTFESLAAAFLAERGLSMSSVGVEPTRDGVMENRLADRALAEAWADYHKAHARLRIVSKKANLGLLRRKS